MKRCELKIPLTNKSSRAVVLTGITASCSCGAPKFTEVAFLPQETKNVDIVIDSRAVAKSFPNGGQLKFVPQFTASVGGEMTAGEAVVAEFSIRQLLNNEPGTVTVVPEMATTVKLQLTEPGSRITNAEAPKWISISINTIENSLELLQIARPSMAEATQHVDIEILTPDGIYESIAVEIFSAYRLGAHFSPDLFEIDLGNVTSISAQLVSSENYTMVGVEHSDLVEIADVQFESGLLTFSATNKSSSLKTCRFIFREADSSHQVEAVIYLVSL